MNIDNKEYKSIIEGLLFTWGDPLSVKDISTILDIDKKLVTQLLDEMMDQFNYDRRGLKIDKFKNGYQLGTRSEHFPWIKKLNKPNPEKNLSNAALETLSIIAYKQPVIKADIESIRGVKCDAAIYTLLDKDLIEEQGRLERIGRPIIYGTTDTFLKVFGLSNLKELPELKKALDIEEKQEIIIEADKKIEQLQLLEDE